MSNKVNQTKELSQKEMELKEKSQRDFLIKEYSSQNKVLKLEAEYEKLQTEIVESKLRRHMALIRYSELMAAQKDFSKKEGVEEEPLKPEANV